ncbi:hypothetical protein ElyMa_004824900 [Elysia marginata]|uniref:Uncharacterized protein n=1 Tax=Elysia marginata TaxID=1093978 RepID=A0AAV4IMT7_9GAST|nr:hypothetical protein ElyMa_004824900 [Elysia marginata]
MDVRVIQCLEAHPLGLPQGGSKQPARPTSRYTSDASHCISRQPLHCKRIRSAHVQASEVYQYHYCLVPVPVVLGA